MQIICPFANHHREVLNNRNAHHQLCKNSLNKYVATDALLTPRGLNSHAPNCILFGYAISSYCI